jgi:hypothetical protein
LHADAGTVHRDPDRTEALGDIETFDHGCFVDDIYGREADTASELVRHRSTV